MKLPSSRSEAQAIPENIRSLAGAVTLRTFDAESFDTTCAEMRKLGFSGLYFCDLFLEKKDLGTKHHEADLVFAEDDAIYVRRPEDQLSELRSIVQRHGLTVTSSHFLQTLPPPGESPEWIFPWHERLLDMAAAMGLKRLTTHIGSMLGMPCERYLGEHARLYVRGMISLDELTSASIDAYGKDKWLPDSVVIYRRLCAAAAERGISITVETAVGEAREICCHIERMIAFIKKVGASNLGICLDVGHCNFRNVSTGECIQKAGDLFLETHVHDNFGDRDSHYPVGIGTVNWREVINEMVAAGYQGDITFEQSDHAVNARNWGLFLEAVEKEWALSSLPGVHDS